MKRINNSSRVAYLTGVENEGKSNIEKDRDRNHRGSIVIIPANANGVCVGRK